VSEPELSLTSVALTVRRMRWWHIEQLIPIEKDLFGVEHWSSAMFWNELANGHHYIVAVEGDEDIIGYAGLSVNSDEAWVQNIAVRRDRQRNGIGRILLEALLAEADRRGAATVLLEVAVNNGPAQRLYDRYGFQAVGLRRGYYQPSNTDALVMRREA
jgi:[ribosomal protein S18]-alanine N-acetyltransferase